MINKIQKKIGVFLKAGTIISTFGFIVITLIQIYGRFFMDKAPSWTEEASRLLFVFAIAFSSGLAMKTDFYVSFDFIFNKITKNWQNHLRKSTYILIIFLCAIFIFYGIQMVSSGWKEQSPSMKFPMAIAFISMPLMGFAIAFYAFIKVVKMTKTKID